MTRKPRPPEPQRPESTFPGEKQGGSSRGSAAHRDEEGLARVWGIAACDLCGGTILLGEHAARVTGAEGTIRMCPACAADSARADRRAA